MDEYASEGDELASEEDVEEIRDSLAEEALLAFFVVAVLMGGDDDDDDNLFVNVSTWANRGAKTLMALYLAGALVRGIRLQPRDFSLSDSSMQDLFDGIALMRSSIREAAEAEADGLGPGPHISPEAAARGAANHALGLITEEIIEEIEDEVADLEDSSAVYKTWVTRQDTRVRPLHVRLNGRTHQYKQPFWVWPGTGQVLDFPGDPRAPMDAIANCRCFMVLSVR